MDVPVPTWVPALFNQRKGIMSRNLKVLGLALVAVFALSAMVASAASASVFTSTSGATVTANQIGSHKFTVTGQTVTCTTAHFTGTASAASFETIEIYPTYENCTASPFNTSATVTGFATGPGKEGCKYVLNANGSAALSCTTGKDVTVNAGPCVVHVPAQTFATGVSYTNGTSGGVGDVTAKFEIKNIKSTHTDGFLCPFEASGESNSAILEGESTVTAAFEGKAVSAQWE
jgi:hypothetical protein